MNRRDKHNYYLDMADVARERGTCLRRNYGAVIVKNDVIVSTGYVGAPRGRANCIDLGTCIRQKMRAFRAVNGTSSAARCTPRPTPLFTRPTSKCWARRSIWSDARHPQVTEAG